MFYNYPLNHVYLIMSNPDIKVFVMVFIQVFIFLNSSEKSSFQNFSIKAEKLEANKP